jgi:hypothetical protein
VGWQVARCSRTVRLGVLIWEVIYHFKRWGARGQVAGHNLKYLEDLRSYWHLSGKWETVEAF